MQNILIMKLNFNKLTLSCGTLLFSTLLHAELIFPDTDSIDQQREKTVILIKQGQVDVGLEKLRQLLSLQPNHQKLIADFVVLSYAAHAFTESDISYLSNIQPTQFPQYGKVSVVKALRDLKQFALAEQYAKQFYAIDRDPNWQVLIGVLQAESGQKIVAKKTLATLNPEQIDADYLAQLSYAYRILDMPIEALTTAELAVQKRADLSTQEQYVLALMANAEHDKAERYIESKGLNNQLKYLVQINQFSIRIQNAIQYYRISTYRDPYNSPYLKLDQVLTDMAAFEAELPQDAKIRRQFYYEYMYALNARNRSDQVLAQIPKIGLRIAEMPAYVRHAIGDAYLKTQQPQLAEVQYLSLLSEKNYADFKVYSSLYYALIEQEKFNQANQVILAMDKLLPTFRYSSAKGVDRATHDDRSEYLSLVGLNYAYRNEHAKAEKYFQDLVAKAPNNVGYQNNLALIQRWREKPQRSEWTLAQWNGIEPVDQATSLNHLLNMQAMTNIAEWRKMNDLLQPIMADDTGMIKSRKELADRNHASIQHQSTFSRSKSDNTDLLNLLKGSREQENTTRINSPWFDDNFRVYAEHHNRSARYQEGNIDDQRIGLGLEWQANRQAASIAVAHSTDGDRFGVQLNWSQWLNDHWQYVLGFTSQADIPLQALAQGYEGKAYAAGLNWQANESTKAGAAYQLTDIDDGNKRKEYSAYFQQRIYQSPHHITSASLTGYYGQNDDVPVSYFNPEKSHSVELTLEHDWMTWRNYERHFNQHFAATIGSFGQEGYSSKPVYNVLYQHEWQLSRTWNLNYGLGWGTHPYDGEDEKRTYAMVGFEGRF